MHIPLRVSSHGLVIKAEDLGSTPPFPLCSSHLDKSFKNRNMIRTKKSAFINFHSNFNNLKKKTISEFNR